MKCPYREVIRFIKPEPVTLNTSEGKITVTLIQTSEYADCYREDCPFYCADERYYRKPICSKVNTETGGEYL